jgi:hypothetical protein
MSYTYITSSMFYCADVLSMVPPGISTCGYPSVLYAAAGGSTGGSAGALAPTSSSTSSSSTSSSSSGHARLVHRTWYRLVHVHLLQSSPGGAGHTCPTSYDSSPWWHCAPPVYRVRDIWTCIHMLGKVNNVMV